jgi:hypothetical protein
MDETAPFICNFVSWLKSLVNLTLRPLYSWERYPVRTEWRCVSPRAVWTFWRNHSCSCMGSSPGSSNSYPSPYSDYAFQTPFKHKPITYTMEQSPSGEANRFSSKSRNSPHFMEPEDSSPHSHMPATCPHPEPARSSTRPSIPFLTIHLNIIILSTPGSSKWSCSLRFHHKNPVYASPFRHTCYMPRPAHSSQFSHPHNFHFTNTGVGKTVWFQASVAV